MKKIIKLAVACAVALAATASVFAKVPENWNFYVGVDAAYYPKSEQLTNLKNDHFAPLTGAYSGLEGRVTGHADYKIATPLGENWLLKDANVVLGTALEISPVSIKPALQVTFTPLPFLVFSAGVQGGTGWDVGPFNGGMALYNTTKRNYSASTPFLNYFYKGWAQATFQFDTGAIFKGDWTHVVMMYSYQVYYEGLTAAKNTDVWTWQCSGDRVNGLKNYQCGILAYQMPLVLYRAGVMFELDGYYNAAAYYNKEFNGDFKQISISPLAQFKINDHNTINVLLGFSSRRSYVYAPVGKSEAYDGRYISREWYFNRVAVSYTYNF